MRFSFALLALPLAAFASPAASFEEVGEAEIFDKRDAGTVIADLNSILKNVNNVNSKLNAFGPTQTPTPIQALAVQGAADDLGKAIQKAITDTKKSGKFSVAQSNSIYNLLKNKLLPATTNLLNNFVKHAPGTKPTYGGIVLSTLKKQKTAVQNLSKALVAKSQGPNVANAKGLTAKFVAAFNKAIKAYS